eukprot:snap_masked-scaffold_1-processed-gene-14.20-mRNA-1 protein AED:1.00 eAED:1.00 QI:0/-1/0/0/-1/1/1/0/83
MEVNFGECQEGDIIMYEKDDFNTPLELLKHSTEAMVFVYKITTVLQVSADKKSFVNARLYHEENIEVAKGVISYSYKRITSLY